MSIARGWGKDGDKHRWEDYISETTKSVFSRIRASTRKEKIKKILDGDKHSRPKKES
jgi:hypothetical protein